MRDINKPGFSGIPFLIIHLILLVGVIAGLIMGIDGHNTVMIVTCIVSLFVIIFCFAGYRMVAPNQGIVLQLFGQYKGTAKEEGLRFVNPFLTSKKVSLRVRNFETDKLKVNDKAGNPIQIAAVVVWKVVDTAEAVFIVNDYENYVAVQSESALRNMATRYHYDSHGGEAQSLSGSTNEISDRLKVEVQNRLEKAGVEVIEARITHLAYAPEIAAAMLQRQQATAVVAARTKIVEGAVGMVDLALKHLSEDGIVEFDDDRKAAMVSNLMVVLCGDRNAQPVVNTGTLH